MEVYNNLKLSRASYERNKLGLALAGGGFRASLFHIGVLKRMADLDILRYVEVLSTVSGGSIIGALYILLLKEKIESKENEKKTVKGMVIVKLKQKDYQDIINSLEEILLSGIRKNLRTLLFMNPLGMLKVLTTSDTLGRRMSRIYERYIYQKAVRKLNKDQSWFDRLFRPGRFSLRHVIMCPGKEKVKGGIEEYNKEAVERNMSAITSLVLNATSLNSGVPFYFSATEIGDSRLGSIRYSDIGEVLDYKYLLEKKDLQGIIEASNNGTIIIGKKEFDKSKALLALWWKSCKDEKKNKEEKEQTFPDGWGIVSEDASLRYKLAKAEFGQLRSMKIPAWYVCRGKDFNPPVTGGIDKEQHLERFWNAFEQIDKEMAEALRYKTENNEKELDLLFNFVIELYLLRSAEVFSGSIREHFESIRLGEAVGASACFPPVFAPMIFTGIYDDLHVERLGLSDGGVYDNIGLSTLLENQCNHIIISDTGGLFDIQQRSSVGRIGMSGRIVSVLMDDVAGQQKIIVRYRRHVAAEIEEFEESTGKSYPEIQGLKNLKSLAFFHINSDCIANSNIKSDPGKKKLLAELRTDLDGFGEVEMYELINTGYDTADRYIREYLINTHYAENKEWKPADALPKTVERDDKDVKKILKVGKSRLFRAVMLNSWISIGISALIAALIIYKLWGIQLSLNQILTKLSGKLLQWISSIPLIGYWTEYPLPLGLVLIAAIVVAVIYFKLPSWIKDFLKNWNIKLFRRMITIKKWSKILIPKNALFLVGMLPAIIAIVSSVVSVVGYIFYYLPFCCKASASGKKSRMC